MLLFALDHPHSVNIHRNSIKTVRPALSFLKNENGGIGFFIASFWNLTNETHLLFSSYLWLFFQIIFSDSIFLLVPTNVFGFFFFFFEKKNDSFLWAQSPEHSASIHRALKSHWVSHNSLYRRKIENWKMPVAVTQLFCNHSFYWMFGSGIKFQIRCKIKNKIRKTFQPPLAGANVRRAPSDLASWSDMKLLLSHWKKHFRCFSPPDR